MPTTCRFAPFMPGHGPDVTFIIQPVIRIRFDAHEGHVFRVSGDARDLVVPIPGMRPDELPVPINTPRQPQQQDRQQQELDEYFHKHCLVDLILVEVEWSRSWPVMFAPDAIDLHGPDDGEEADEIRPDVIQEHSHAQREHAQAEGTIGLHGSVE